MYMRNPDPDSRSLFFRRSILDQRDNRRYLVLHPSRKRAMRKVEKDYIIGAISREECIERLFRQLETDLVSLPELLWIAFCKFITYCFIAIIVIDTIFVIWYLSYWLLVGTPPFEPSWFTCPPGLRDCQ